MNYDYIIIGAGVAGCTAARLLAEQNKKILILEKTNGIGGQTYDEHINNILTQKFGIHILYTNEDRVINFLNRFSTMIPTRMTAQSYVNGKMIPLPINFHTLDAWFGKEVSKQLQLQLLEHFDYGQKVSFKQLVDEDEQYNILTAKQIHNLQNLFNVLFVEYSKKQWKEFFPGNTIIDRIPITIGYEDYYLPATYHTVPKFGYTKMFTNMIQHPYIQVLLNIDYSDILQYRNNKIFFNKAFNFEKEPIIINTTRIDKFFNCCKGHLQWKSLKFEYEYTDKRQTTNAVHYPVNFHYLRTTDCKTIYQQDGKTMIVKEIPADITEGEPFYTIETDNNKKLAQEYLSLSKNCETQIIHLGRAAEYKYYRMDELIIRIMEEFKK